MSAISLLDMVNAMILLPDTPQEGDFIALDWDESHPNDFTLQSEQCISWCCSQVVEVDGDRYKVSYDNGDRWYKFKEFGTPKTNKDGVTATYPALPDLTNNQDKR